MCYRFFVLAITNFIVEVTEGTPAEFESCVGMNWCFWHKGRNKKCLEPLGSFCWKNNTKIISAVSFRFQSQAQALLLWSNALHCLQTPTAPSLRLYLLCSDFSILWGSVLDTAQIAAEARGWMALVRTWFCLIRRGQETSCQLSSSHLFLLS